MKNDPFRESNEHDGQGPRYFLVAREDPMTIDIIGRGVFLGFREVKANEVIKGNERMVGSHDGKIALDGGGAAWFHEAEEVVEDRKFDRYVGTRQLRKLPRPEQKDRVA